MILSENIYPVPFIVFVMIGATAAILLVVSLAISWPWTHVRIEQWYFFAKIALVALLFLGLGFRFRVVTFHEDRGDVTISWGKRLPLTYQTFHADEWSGFTVTRYTPVGIMPTGDITRVYHLAPRWRLDGITNAGKTIALGTFATEGEADNWKTTLASVAK